VSVKVCTPVEVNGPAVLPTLDISSEPDHPPEALQEVAFWVVHASWVVCPTSIAEGVAVKEVTMAADGRLVTVSIADWGRLVPQGPVQTSVYVSIPAALIVPVLAPVLKVGSAPDQAPDAAHEVAPVVVQAKMAASPVWIVGGVIVKLVINATPLVGVITFSETELPVEPPGPVQVSM
jgi:hypothetical protein